MKGEHPRVLAHALQACRGSIRCSPHVLECIPSAYDGGGALGYGKYLIQNARSLLGQLKAHVARHHLGQASDAPPSLLLTPRHQQAFGQAPAFARANGQWLEWPCQRSGYFHVHAKTTEVGAGRSREPTCMCPWSSWPVQASTTTQALHVTLGPPWSAALFMVPASWQDSLLANPSSKTAVAPAPQSFVCCLGSHFGAPGACLAGPFLPGCHCGSTVLRLWLAWPLFTFFLLAACDFPWVGSRSDNF